MRAMRISSTTRSVLAALIVSLLGTGLIAQQKPSAPFEPTVGQAGKDVIWVPTPDALVAKMMELGKVTPQDYVIDLGSGDGRTVIAAAKRGAKALGVEYEQKMVDLSKQRAAAAGVGDKAQFVKADLFEYDFSQANVLTMFLLPSINMQLRPKILDMKPGTRIVTNSFDMEDWKADKSETVTADCNNWCTAHMWIVPAKVEGVWQLPQGTLTLKQQFQEITGTLGSAAIQGELTGAQISFKVGNDHYTGQVDGNTMKGTLAGGATWTATKK
jgi:SAM-dependent methyltransferase